jgi:CheY-like chemotaxis protein
MNEPDFQIKENSYTTSCFHCRALFDALTASWCDCIARERTFVCPHCGSCACDAPNRIRNEFWMNAPLALWERRRNERSDVVTRLRSIDPYSLPRPFALIVDDDPLVLSVTERVLRAIGFATLTSEKPEEAYAIAQALIPDLLLTDALMPKLDGRELCRRLKDDDETRGIKIIVMSALYHGVGYRNEAFKQFHVDEYLEKPIKPGILREAVDRLMPEVARVHPHSNDVRLAS